ncbi:MAG: DUF2809 domain-containing protein [Bacteroidetes bacterium]|nr:DUF2809 domain-containing protein [Bacteroidota bacterium]
MIRQRIKYFLITCCIVVLGLLSRHFTIFPLWIGDVLWATMIYFILRFFLLKAPIRKIALISIVVSYAIEFSQLYQAEWIDNLRHTFLGRMILGETFFWGDLVSYTAGILIGICIEVWVVKPKYS